MPLQPWMKLLSTDDHLIEHPRVWTDRLPKRFQDAGPRIVEMPREGKAPAQVWKYEDRIYPYIGLNAVAGKDLTEFGTEPTSYADMIPGCYDPKARVADMDIDGVWGGVNFPTFPRYAGTVFLEAKDKELALLGLKAWNDFCVDEWCATAPDRFIPIMLIPLWDIDASIEEIRRCHAKGAKCIGFPENPVPLGLPSFHTDHWDRLFDVVEELDMPLTMHFGTSGRTPSTAPEAPFAVTIALFATNSMFALADILFSPLLHRHPKLKIGLAEGGIGWMPYLLERSDMTWERHRYYQNINREVRPSELFRRHFHGCFIDDFFGVKNRHDIGVDNITWECDYPHSDSYWPHSRKRAAEAFADVPDDEVHKMVELNVRRLYNFPA